MPYASIERPSIQISLLKSVVERAGHSAATFHFNLDFVAALKQHLNDAANEVYDTIVQHRFAAGDWFFAKAAFGAAAPDPQLMLDCWVDNGELAAEYADSLLDLYEVVVPEYVTGLAEGVDWSAFDVVGFSSTFQQNVSSFALARQIKERHPDVVILFGGSNFDDVMGREWVRSMPFIDFAIQGEAEESLTAFLAALSTDQSPLGVPGVVGRSSGAVVGTPAESIEDLNRSPAPDYTEYFDRLERLQLMHRLEVQVPFESARGCWWGEKRHCTFCGLNQQAMSYRSKDAGQVLRDLTDVALRHRVVAFTAVDNIMDRSYFDTLMPELASQGRPFRLFYETKADLTRDEVELLVRGGVDIIQPGIESLSSHVLSLMRKGTRAIWNVNVLRWLTYYGLVVHWNMLYGLPGETTEDIADQTRAVRQLTHLEAPGSFGRVWMERFSPLFRERDQFPVDYIEPNARYRYVYPDHVDLDQASYFFDYSFEHTLPDEAFAELGAAVQRWRDLWEDPESPPTMLAEHHDGEVWILDNRDRESERKHHLVGHRAAIHQACWETWRTPKQIAEETGLAIDTVAEGLASLVEQQLLYQDRNLYVSLALPSDPPNIRARPSLLLDR